MTILRNGKLVEERMVAETSQLELVKLMIGRELEVARPARPQGQRPDARTSPARPCSRRSASGRKGSLEATDLELYEGEVIGLAGLLGSGRTELARLLFGADTADTGEVVIRSERRRLRSPRHAIDRKVAFSSEDRKAEGVVGDLTVRRQHAPRAAGLARLAAADPAGDAGPSSSSSTSRRSTSGPPTRRR